MNCSGAAPSPTVELARRVYLSRLPCMASVKALKTAGVTQGYAAPTSAAALGLGLNVFISISLTMQSNKSLAYIEPRIGQHDEATC